MVKQILLPDRALFFRYFRMSPTKFEELLKKVAPRIEKSAETREPICPSERLSIALRYLFTGDAQTTIAASFRVSPSSIGRIIYETTNVNVEKAPVTSDSTFFNYKESHSIVLMAVCDINYKFMMVDNGDSGRNSDGGVFSSCDLRIAINEDEFNTSQPEPIWGRKLSFPLVFDEAIP